MDTTSPSEAQSLRSLLSAADSQREALDAAPDATSPDYPHRLQSALAAYELILARVSAAALFSPNEGLEDLSTSSMPYLLADFYLAELIQRTPRLSPRERLRILALARSSYERFLSLVDHYALIPHAHSPLLSRYRDDPEAFSLVPPSSSSSSSASAASRRDAKLAHHRAQRELSHRLLTLQRSPRLLDDDDDEAVRQVHVASIHLAIHNALQGLDSLNRELPLLAAAPEPDPSTTPRPPDARDAQETLALRLDPSHARLRPGQPLLTKQGRPLQPFTLVGSRADRARAVFRPGHALPTMSIDEYLDEERRRGNILQGGTDPPTTVLDEDDMDAVDAETYKARDWDDFKDDHRRGAGNTLNMG